MTKDLSSHACPTQTVVGTDIADLLLKEHRSVWLPGKSPNEANLIDFNNEPLERAEEEQGAGPLSLLSDTFMTVPENVSKETERFRELLLFGRKKAGNRSAAVGGGGAGWRTQCFIAGGV